MGLFGGDVLLQGVAHMGFDPEYRPRSVPSFVGVRGDFGASPNRRRVKVSGATKGGRIIS